MQEVTLFHVHLSVTKATKPGLYFVLVYFLLLHFCV